MVFMKKSEIARRQKTSQAATLRHERNRAKKKQQQEGTMVAVGRRIVELDQLSKHMWCDHCNIPLSFRFLEEETQCGLSSTFKIRCMQCLELFNITSSAKAPNPDTCDSSRTLYVVNCKAALGCVDAGVGHEQFNKLLSALNLPVVHRNTMKLAEERFGKCLIEVAKESCQEAIAEEKSLTIAKRSPEGSPCIS